MNEIVKVCLIIWAYEKQFIIDQVILLVFLKLIILGFRSKKSIQIHCHCHQHQRHTVVHLI